MKIFELFSRFSREESKKSEVGKSYYYDEKNHLILGVPPWIDDWHEGIWGDFTRILGEVKKVHGRVSSKIKGDISRLYGRIHFQERDLVGEIHPQLYGDVTALYGDLTGVRGEASDWRGDLSISKITEKERRSKEGVDIAELAARSDSSIWR
jgi:hypothetical protein